MFDKYDDVVLLPVVVAVFIVDFGSQLVMEYDFVCFVESISAILWIESDEALANTGVVGRAGDTALLGVPYEYGIDGREPSVDTFDKYDALLLLVVTSPPSEFGDQCVMEYDFAVDALISAFGDSPVDVAIEYWRYI